MPNVQRFINQTPGKEPMQDTCQTSRIGRILVIIPVAILAL